MFPVKVYQRSTWLVTGYIDTARFMESGIVCDHIIQSCLSGPTVSTGDRDIPMQIRLDNSVSVFYFNIVLLK